MNPVGKRWLLWIAELGLVILILGILALIWLPAWVGAAGVSAVRDFPQALSTERTVA